MKMYVHSTITFPEYPGVTFFYDAANDISAGVGHPTATLSPSEMEN